MKWRYVQVALALALAIMLLQAFPEGAGGAGHPAPTITSITPASAQTDTIVDIDDLTGTGFWGTPQVVLRKVGMDIAAGALHTICLMSDGTVRRVGDDSYGQCGYPQAYPDPNVAAVDAGYNHSVYLSKDGTVLALGNNTSGQCSVGDWAGITAIAAGGSHTLGMKQDGTVVATGKDDKGQCDVSGWTGIAAIAAGDNHSLGLRQDGTVLAVGNNASGQCGVSGWSGITTVAAGSYHTLGLKQDGSVVAVGSDTSGQCNVGGWADIKAISAGSSHSVAIKTDGSVLAVGRNESGQCNVSGWTEDVAATGVTVASPTRINCSFDLTDVRFGLWSVVAINEDSRCAFLINGFEVQQNTAAKVFHFAEGYTGQGFQTYLCLYNPGPAKANVSVRFFSWTPHNLEMEAGTRHTINVNEVWGPDCEVAASIVSDKPIVAERAMYFNYNGVWRGGHCVIGATSASTTWYFAEGYTGPGFDEYICVYKPAEKYPDPANLEFRFQTQEGQEVVVTGFTVPDSGRVTFKVNDILGTDYQNSLKLESDRPVVAERAMYFNYQGTGNWNWTGGHCVTGAKDLSSQYYFAEGTTRAGFEQWLTLQNPGGQDIVVDAVYQLGEGQGDPVFRSYTVGAGKRHTVFVPAEVGWDKDVSVHLSSSSDFLAERPMYFSYYYDGLGVRGGHCVVGAKTDSNDWLLAEGYTGPGFQQWICIQNPSDADATVDVTYFTQEAGALAAKTETVPANSRKTLMVNEHAGLNYQLSTRIRVVSGPNVVVERPMYFIFNGWDGGHDVVGYAP